MGVLQRGVVLDGHQAVLKAVALPDVVMDVARGDHADSQLPGQGGQTLIAPGVSLDQVLLQLQEIVAFPEEPQVEGGGLGGLGEAARVQ